MVYFGDIRSCSSFVAVARDVMFFVYEVMFENGMEEEVVKKWYLMIKEVV